MVSGLFAFCYKAYFDLILLLIRAIELKNLIGPRLSIIRKTLSDQKIRLDMEFTLEEKDAADWTYRGEGAANLVIAYTGSSSSLIGKVMRIQKALRNGSRRSESPKALSKQERLLWKDIESLVSSANNETVSQLYVKYVMTPLLGSKYVDSGVRVPVTRGFLEAVEKNIVRQRPAWRVDAAKIDMCCDSVLLLSDHSLFPPSIQKDQLSYNLKKEDDQPCISVEIKPKCGFLPLSEFIDEGNSVKHHITRFRMHQALKLNQGKVSEYSEYDPLDLFSRNKDRILKAIRDLFATPQNNFRVFKNGFMIIGGSGGNAESTNSAIKKTFGDALEGFIQTNHDQRAESFLQLLSDAIYKSGIMDRLLEVQKLDSFDIEGAIHAYYDIISEPCTVCKELGEEKALERHTSLHHISLEESLKILKDFLIAATAKDCSLMISFRPRKEEKYASSYHSVYLESTKQTFDYKVYFIDLDLKPLKKMEEYYELDRKVVNCYTQVVKQEKGVAVKPRSNGGYENTIKA